MTSVLTIVRDHIIAEFERRKSDEFGRVREFEISPVWLSETENTRSSVYCVVISGETRQPGTMNDDLWEMRGKVIVWAHDTRDAQAKCNEMIEDALDVLRMAFKTLIGTIESARYDDWDGPEPTTMMADWAQAVIPWSCKHRRAGIL